MKIKYSEEISIWHGKGYMKGEILKNSLHGRDSDIIRSELADLPVVRLNVRSSSGLVDESGSRLDPMIRSG